MPCKPIKKVCDARIIFLLMLNWQNLLHYNWFGWMCGEAFFHLVSNIASDGLRWIPEFARNLTLGCLLRVLLVYVCDKSAQIAFIVILIMAILNRAASRYNINCYSDFSRSNQMIFACLCFSSLRSKIVWRSGAADMKICIFAQGQHEAWWRAN